MKQSAFIAALKFASHAMATKDVRYYLNGVCIELMGNTMFIIGTDGHRMAIAELEDDNSGGLLEGKGHGPQFIIEADSVKILLTMFKANSTGHMDFAFEGETVTISGAAGSLPCKVIEGKYPDWRRVAKSEGLQAGGPRPAPTEEIAFNSDYIAAAAKACGALDSTRYSVAKFQFYGPHEGVKVSAPASSLPTGIRFAWVIVVPSRI